MASLCLGLASAEFLSLVIISFYPQFPGWSQGSEGSLVIALGNEDALGEYSCTPYNSLGTAGPSPVTRVLLKAPPAFLERPQEEYFQEVGRELLIPCSAQGDPPPTVSWAKVRLLSPLCLSSAHSARSFLCSWPFVGRRMLKWEGCQKQGGKEAEVAWRDKWHPW